MPSPLDKEAKKALVRRFFDTFSTRDADAVLALMVENPTWSFFNRPFPGRDGVRGILRASSELYREGSHRRTWLAQYVDGDTVISQMKLEAVTFKGEVYENFYVQIVHLDGDKVARVEEYMDTAYGDAKFAGWKMPP
jgi:ketosteroid isomerase-like protein